MSRSASDTGLLNRKGGSLSAGRAAGEQKQIGIRTSMRDVAQIRGPLQDNCESREISKFNLRLGFHLRVSVAYFI